MVGAWSTIEDAGVGQGGYAVEARDWWHERDVLPAAITMLPCSEPAPVHGKRVRRDEARLAAELGGAQGGEPRLGIRGGDGGDDAMHVVLHRLRTSRSRVPAGGCRSRAALRAAAAACDAANNAFARDAAEIRGKSPPIRSRSIRTTRRPSCAATAVTDRPAAPRADHRQIEVRHSNASRGARRPATARAPRGRSAGRGRWARKMMLRSGAPPCASTLPTPEPMDV